jgi:large subunit ribosomal protein L40e
MTTLMRYMAQTSVEKINTVPKELIILPTIHILPSFITVHIKTATGKSMFIKINPSDTILQLKKKIYLEEDVSLESQRIIYGGKQLDDHHTICHYNITAESILHIVLRLRGGMFHKSSSRADFVSLNYSNKMERGLSMLDYMKRESSREMVTVLEDFEDMIRNTRDDVEIDMVYELIHKIYSE